MATITKTIIEQITWGDIQRIVDAGNADSFNVGQIITDTMQDGREMPYAIAAINHYQQDEIIFVNRVSYGNHCMNESGENTGWWNGCEMRRYANNDIYNLLSPELRAVIAPRTIVEVKGRKKVESIDKLWCLSPMEVGGEWFSAIQTEGDKQFPFFKEQKNRQLVDADGEGDVCYWWERSPNRNYSSNFYYVYASGNPYHSHYANNRLGVCLGFVIRKSK